MRSLMITFLKFAGYILLKWICFFGYQYMESEKKWDWDKMQSKEDTLYTAWMLLALPALEIILLILPFQLALRQKGLVMVIVLVLIFALEFAIGWFATNQQIAVWMIVKIIFSAGLFFLLYRKQLNF